MRDETKTRIMNPAVRNLVNRERLSLSSKNDVSEFRLPRGKTFWITGAGPTLKPWMEEGLGGFVVANQSTADCLAEYGRMPDLIVLADPQDCISDWLSRFEGKYGASVPVFASTLTGVKDAPNHFFYKPFLNVGKDPGDRPYEHLFNNVVHAATPAIATFLLQAGNVTNAATLAILELSKEQGLEPCMAYAGVDFEFLFGRTRSAKYDAKSGWDSPPMYEDGPSIVLFGGRVSTYQLLTYRKELATIVEAHRDRASFCVYVPEQVVGSAFIHLLEDFMGRY